MSSPASVFLSVESAEVVVADCLLVGSGAEVAIGGCLFTELVEFSAADRDGGADMLEIGLAASLLSTSMSPSISATV